MPDSQKQVSDSLSQNQMSEGNIGTDRFGHTEVVRAAVDTEGSQEHVVEYAWQDSEKMVSLYYRC